MQQIKTLVKALLSSLTVALLLLLSASVSAQDRCGTVLYTQKLQDRKVIKESDQQFEQWLLQKQQAQPRQSGQLRTKATYQVPVVVHIIHNGLTHATNISDAQVLSQIAVLNKDYKRQNADASSTPADFISVAGSLDIEFVLAKRTPEGLATNGIVRVQGTKSSWTMDDNYQIKSQSYWPAEDYLNIWVCNLTDYLGYSQFPVSNLPGLENSSTNRLTDGVVIAYQAFGSDDDGNFDLESKYNKGRTATHEVGHFFGLRHIWGDGGGCNSTDYVSDTPIQSGSTNNCPTHPQENTCNIVSMFQNYLDYTNDACMNLFTKGQVDRMITILSNSPRRNTLLNSPGLQEPAPVPNDVGIRRVVTPAAGACSTTIVPEIEIRNYGSNTATQTRIQVTQDGLIVETKDFTLNLAPLEITTISFSPTVLTTGDHTMAFEIIETNTTTDGNEKDNLKEQSFTIQQSITTPFSENFNTVPSSWSIINPDQNVTWQLATAPMASTSNKAMKMNFYDYEDNLAEVDLLVTPVFDLSASPVVLLLFDIAYARFESNSNDGLKVIALTDCNTDINQGTVIYNKTGAALATTSATNSPFTPANGTQWRTEAINLSAFIGQRYVQLAFVGINDWGNNLYLDNIQVLTDNFENLTLQKVTIPSPVTCAQHVTPVLQLKNSGTAIYSFDVNYSVNGISSTAAYTGLSFKAGTEMSITLPGITLADGENNLTFELLNPNGLADREPSDDDIFYKTLVNKTADKIPFRENFEQTDPAPWSTINPSGGMDWEITALSKNKAAYIDGFSNTMLGDEAWLVSPVLDFSVTNEASLFFDLSYAHRENRNDQLKIMASADCGSNFNYLLDTYQGSRLSDSTTSARWEPAVAEDWSRRSVSLGALAGKQNVRLAFVFSNNNGNNLYLDNIEVFLSENPLRTSEALAVYPNPATYDNINLTFNLPERQNITLDVTDAMGRSLISNNIPDVLNQTYSLALREPAAGMFLIRVKTRDHVFVSKVIVK